MSREILGAHQKALQINLDPSSYGTFAEIGAGQEVARWFFHVGGAAGTVAKTMSAYDMAFSDAIYGKCRRYVSRERLQTMLDHEYELLVERLDGIRGVNTHFFVFADTVAARGYRSSGECHGWLGIRFQIAPRSTPSQILIHVRMLDRENIQQQDALGIMGVNLIWGALTLHHDPKLLILSLMDNLTTDRVEVDVAHLSGPAFAHVDNRLMCLELVNHGMTNAVMFTSKGEVVLAADALYKKAIMVERGNFRPVTNLTMDLINSAYRQFTNDPHVKDQDTVLLLEMTLRSLTTGNGIIDHQDFLDRADMLGALGHNVLISNYARFFKLAEYLFRHTKSPVGIAIGAPTLKVLFDEQYYQDLEGGILESFGRMFRNDLKLYLYPMNDPVTKDLVTADNFKPQAHLQHLYSYIREKRYVEDIREYNAGCLNITSQSVLDLLHSGDPAWENMVPPSVAAFIKSRRLFGCVPHIKSKVPS